VAAAARYREKGYFEYLDELRAARDGYGKAAADWQLALDLAFAQKEAEKANPK
jgi:hypothetical protein